MPFKPGKDWNGNKEGRPKGTLSLRMRLIRKLEREIGEDDSNVIVADQIIDQIVEGAKKGQFPNIKEIFDRIDGKPLQTLEHSGPDGGKIDHSISITFVNAETRP